MARVGSFDPVVYGPTRTDFDLDIGGRFDRDLIPVLPSAGPTPIRKFGRPGGGGAWPPVDIYGPADLPELLAALPPIASLETMGSFGALGSIGALGSLDTLGGRLDYKLLMLVTGVLWTPGFERMTLEEWMRTEWFASWRERWADLASWRDRWAEREADYAILPMGGEGLIVRAVEAGRIEYKHDPKAGLVATLTTKSGVRYVYASVRGGDPGTGRSVRAGDVIGRTAGTSFRAPPTVTKFLPSGAVVERKALGAATETKTEPVRSKKPRRTALALANATPKRSMLKDLVYVLALVLTLGVIARAPSKPVRRSKRR